MKLENNSVYQYIQFLSCFFLIIFIFAHLFLLAANRRQRATPIGNISQSDEKEELTKLLRIAHCSFTV